LPLVSIAVTAMLYVAFVVNPVSRTLTVWPGPGAEVGDPTWRKAEPGQGAPVA
jgi:hypothetical protein